MHPLVLILAPLALLAVIALFGFVGCDPVQPTNFTDYRNLILQENGLIAFWPLDDGYGSSTAQDIKGSATGAWLTMPGGSCGLDSSGVVPGDAPGGNTARAADLDGGYVSVPYDAQLNPLQASAFTVELWAYVNWNVFDTPAKRTLVSCCNQNLGFELYASSASLWEVWTKDGSMPSTANSFSSLSNGATSHIVFTYDALADPTSPTLKLYVDGVLRENRVHATYKPLPSSHPLLIGASGAGGGASDLWRGRIQDVAFYGVALSDATIKTHCDRGNGHGP